MFQECCVRHTLLRGFHKAPKRSMTRTCIRPTTTTTRGEIITVSVSDYFVHGIRAPVGRHGDRDLLLPQAAHELLVGPLGERVVPRQTRDHARSTGRDVVAIKGERRRDELRVGQSGDMDTVGGLTKVAGDLEYVPPEGVRRGGRGGGGGSWRRRRRRRRGRRRRRRRGRGSGEGAAFPHILWFDGRDTEGDNTPRNR